MKENEKQQRDTKQRRLILETVISHGDHPDADDIYLDVHNTDEKISKGTVYRNLKLLSENGDIRHVKIPGTDRYDRTLPPHYHILCIGCGKVIDAPLEYTREFDGLISSQTGFIIKGHRMVFEGLCPECQKK